MLMLRGPVKVDLIFDEPHEHEPPWEPQRDTLAALDRHFWDWTLWLASKRAAGRSQLVAAELEKLFEHLLRPMGAREAPHNLRRAMELYLRLRGQLERRFAVEVPRTLEHAVSPVVWRASS
jgi:hypothetical protein